jgi:hypothetical protein
MILGLITSWSKKHIRHKTKPMVMDVVVLDKTKVLEEREDGPSRAMMKSMLRSVLHD